MYSSCRIGLPPLATRWGICGGFFVCLAFVYDPQDGGWQFGGIVWFMMVRWPHFP